VPFLLPSMLTLLHEDEALLAFDKPAGLLAVPGRGPGKQDCLAARVLACWPDALVVHRLDQATSGLMLFARGAEMQRRLSRDFAARRIVKQYVALVAGPVDANSGTIDLPLTADWPNRPRQQVHTQLGKPSLTHWQVLQRSAGHTRLALQPLTGRTHQLRVHLAAIGHPILGDALYGSSAAAPRLMLHATSMWLDHPLHGTRLQLDCATPF
jgi:tRNA pseudouridine32 synthase / 23S rRNA pseudouridine746 synthase